MGTLSSGVNGWGEELKTWAGGPRPTPFALTSCQDYTLLVGVWKPIQGGLVPAFLPR